MERGDRSSRLPLSTAVGRGLGGGASPGVDWQHPRRGRADRDRPGADVQWGYGIASGTRSPGRSRRHPVNSTEREDTTIYTVVVNHEEQYSIWPAGRDLPLGWSDAGKSGPKADCLEYIEEVWTDMRPLSLRQRMEQSDGRR